jgi:hypothetical protein
MRRIAKRELLWLAVGCLLIGCGGEREGTKILPNAETVPGWEPAGNEEAYGKENLYDLVDGQADAFFAYAFESVAVQTYETDTGETVRVEVWEMGTPADAYGLFTTYRVGDPVSVGSEGDGDPGRRLDFWQHRYFVRVFAFSPLDDAVLVTFASAVSGALPSGGDRPSLLGELPQDGLVEDQSIFFRQEISIQDRLWLGGQNLLGLTPDTEAILATYQLVSGMASLLLVQYSDSESASAGIVSLEKGGISDLVVAGVEGKRLVAVFGKVSESEAQELLAGALGTR